MNFPINGYFVTHPEMVLGTWSRQDTLYGNGYSLKSQGNLAGRLREAIARLPEFPTRERTDTALPFVPPAANAPGSDGSFVLGADRRILQRTNGELVPVVYGGTALAAHGSLVGRRMAALIGLRDKARRVLRSQNQGWPEATRDEARMELNREYDRFVSAHGPINKTTFSETRDGTWIRRMPNLVKFREDLSANCRTTRACCR